MEKKSNHQKDPTKSGQSFLSSSGAVTSVADRWNNQTVHVERTTVDHSNAVLPVASVASPDIAGGAIHRGTGARHRPIVPTAGLRSTHIRTWCCRRKLSTARRCESDPTDSGREQRGVTDTTTTRGCQSSGIADRCVRRALREAPGSGGWSNGGRRA